ncbi:uncharacterized protein I303_104904 [Kwoniella dejecticola CBS 10117]|uniref:Uncharacterized protein n=1 Tax=Kwoniella dejecticola CBS 10117 TaxID=1296121 RepID=A0A1A6A418_9TREE|nr:uncharacterized protein I303_05650 [Kwoniella dejecticola CBS 10117]OBR84791.1 hypothetical protein I303_05650 [Kwoniella dejecticola CBS 10117]
MPPTTDFSSAEYWSKRFESEESFEWLISDKDLLPFVNDNLPVSFVQPEGNVNHDLSERVFNVLHFGSGSSSLGKSLQRHLNRHCYNTHKKKRIQIYDSDYVQTPYTSFPTPSNPNPIPNPSPSPTQEQDIGEDEDVVPFLLIDVLSLDSLQTTSSQNGVSRWDLIIDKSTCDAISCSPSLPPDTIKINGEAGSIGGSPSDAVERLLFNLSRVTENGARWISISYSSNRFSLPDTKSESTSNSASDPNQKSDSPGKQSIPEKYGWKLVDKRMISTTYIPGGKRVKDPKTGEERIVHEPETGVWMYVLERI